MDPQGKRRKRPSAKGSVPYLSSSLPLPPRRRQCKRSLSSSSHPPDPSSSPTLSRSPSPSPSTKRLVFADHEEQLEPTSSHLLLLSEPVLSASTGSSSQTSSMTALSRPWKSGTASPAAQALTIPDGEPSQLKPNAPTLLAPDSRMTQTSSEGGTAASASSDGPSAFASTSSSLFGSVMSHVKENRIRKLNANSGTSGFAPAVSSTAFSSSATPTKASAGGMRPPPLTPTNYPCAVIAAELLPEAAASSTSAAGSLNHNAFAASPGGFKLLDFLDTVHSPFQYSKHHHNHRGATGTPSARPPSTPSSTAAVEQEEEQDESNAVERDPWAETWIDTRSGSARPLGLVDWVVHESVRVVVVVEDEDSGNATTSRLGRTILRPRNVATVEFRARQRFLLQSSSGTMANGATCCVGHSVESADKEEECSIRWKAGLLYWQYPPSPLQLGGQWCNATRKVESSGASTAASLKAMPPPARQNSVLPPVDGAAAKPRAGNGAFPNNRANPCSCFWEKQWQQAFRSLYVAWIHRLRRMSPSLRVNQRADDLTPEDCYFYAMGCGYSVLFRAGAAPPPSPPPADSSSAADSCAPEPFIFQVQPEIVLSASSRALRAQLRDMGAELRLLDRWDGRSGIFDEEWLHPSDRNSSSCSASMLDAQGMASPLPAKGSAPPEAFSPALKAELAALRRAQILGQTVGATVSVAMQPKRRFSQAAAAAQGPAPPLVLAGWDDCALFMELFLNTCGRVLQESDSCSSDCKTCGDWACARSTPALPILLCRQVGPFMHSSLEKLIEKRDADGAIRVQGMVLPCAVRHLVASAASALKAAEERQTSNAMKESPTIAGATTGLLTGRVATAQSLHPLTSQHVESLTLSLNLAACQLAFYLAAHPGFEPPLQSNAGSTTSGEIGWQGTDWMNNCVEASDSGADRRLKRLECGQRSSVIVWDAALPDSIAYCVHNVLGSMLISY